MYNSPKRKISQKGRKPVTSKSRLQRARQRSQKGGKPRTSKSRLQRTRLRSQKGGKPRTSKSRLQRARQRSQKGGKPRTSKSRLQRTRLRSQKGGKPRSLKNIPVNILRFVRQVPGITGLEKSINNIYSELQKGQGGKNPPNSCRICEKCETAKCQKMCTGGPGKLGKIYRQCIDDLCKHNYSEDTDVVTKPTCNNKYSVAIKNFTNKLGNPTELCLNHVGIKTVLGVTQFIWGYLVWYVQKQMIGESSNEQQEDVFSKRATEGTHATLLRDWVAEPVGSVVMKWMNRASPRSNAGKKAAKHLVRVKEAAKMAREIDAERAKRVKAKEEEEVHQYMLDNKLIIKF